MTLSWTLDKVGPMCRTVEDCALVFDAIRGPDEHDPTVVNASFAWEPEVDMASLRIGYIERDFDVEGEAAERNKSTLEALKAMGATLVPIALPEFPLNALQMILYTEAAAAFDELTRNNRDDLLIRQEEKYWANQLRVARLVPAVEYIQVQRIRRRLIEAMAALMQTIDLYVAPAEGDNVWVTNLSGHPAVTMLNGFLSSGLPTSISLVGQLDDEARLLAVAKQYQMQTSYHKQIPPLFAPGQP
jgi:Asp-tRNA(Asn)/Glu-tRNA(Gln) amidotransferase A subunit family amidase